MMAFQVKFLENLAHLQRILTFWSYLQHEKKEASFGGFYYFFFQFLNGFIFVVGLFFYGDGDVFCLVLC